MSADNVKPESFPGAALDRDGYFNPEAESADLAAMLNDVRAELTQANAFTVTVVNALEAISADGCVEARLTLTECSRILWDQMQRLEWAVENGRVIGEKVTVPKWVQP
ncbi:MAG: hypothetical protein ACRD3Q_17580 [Terriglobales bacterium]